MPAAAPELEQVAPHCLIWQAYDRTAKADLCSTAVVTDSGTYLIDPIPLVDSARITLLQLGSIAGIIVTNANHHRACAEFAATFSAPIYANQSSFPEAKPDRFEEIGARIGESLRVIPIEGAAPGELAIYDEAKSGTLILGDALINFEPYGFSLLPPKYCSNEPEMRQSLRKLLAVNFERIFFAHGTPLLSNAGAKLHQLLSSDQKAKR
jgi:glyoxylase-like metal-dependent hydrolase (beta-lactamase superfamily II)